MARLRELIVEIRARTERFTQGLDSAQNRLGAFAKSAKGLAGLAIGGLSVTGLVAATKAALDHGDAIAKTSREVNLGAESYQKLVIGGGQAGVAQEKLNVALRTLNRNVGQAKTGMGPLVGMFREYDKTLLQGIQSSTSQEQALDLIFSKINATADATEKAAIANAAFGESGGAMVMMAAGYKEAGDKAERLNQIISGDLLGGAEAALDAMDDVSKTINAQFKSALIQAAPYIGSMATSLSALTVAAVKWYDARFVDDTQITTLEQLNSRLQDAQTEVTKWGQALENVTLIDKIFNRDDMMGEKFMDASKRMAELRRQAKRLDAEKAEKDGTSAVTQELVASTALEQKLKQVNDAVGGNISELSKYKDVLKTVKEEFETLRPEKSIDTESEKGKAMALVSVYDSLGKISRDTGAGNFEGALETAREAKDTLMALQSAGETVPMDLINNVTNLALAAAQNLQEVANAAIDFDKTATEANIDKLLEAIQAKASTKPIIVPVQMEWTGGAGTQASGGDAATLHEMLPLHALKGGY